AGDTFIAAMLFGLMTRKQTAETPAQHDRALWSLKQRLDFANALAGRKILQDGFQGLGDLNED
ncbi:hypothetical protein LTR37_006683, partial [Vermiconidia calcicola]